jgi:hypothetical protein
VADVRRKGQTSLIAYLTHARELGRPGERRARAITRLKSAIACNLPRLLVMPSRDCEPRHGSSFAVADRVISLARETADTVGARQPTPSQPRFDVLIRPATVTMRGASARFTTRRHLNQLRCRRHDRGIPLTSRNPAAQGHCGTAVAPDNERSGAYRNRVAAPLDSAYRLKEVSDLLPGARALTVFRLKGL